MALCAPIVQLRYSSFFNCIFSVAFTFFCNLRYMLPLMHVVFCCAYKSFPRISMSFFYSFHSHYFEFWFVWGERPESPRRVSSRTHKAYFPLHGFSPYFLHYYYCYVILCLWRTFKILYTLNLLYMTSKVRFVAIFMIAVLQTCCT